MSLVILYLKPHLNYIQYIFYTPNNIIKLIEMSKLKTNI